MSIDDLVLFDSNKAQAGEYDPDTFKEGLSSLSIALHEEVPNETIRTLLISLKESLKNFPQIIHELKDEDVGILVAGIKRISDVILVKDQTKQTRKKAKSNISRRELADLINKPPDDF